MCVSHFSGSVGAELEAAADHIKEESHQAMEHSCSEREEGSSASEDHVTRPDLT